MSSTVEIPCFTRKWVGKWAGTTAGVILLGLVVFGFAGCKGGDASNDGGQGGSAGANSGMGGGAGTGGAGTGGGAGVDAAAGGTGGSPVDAGTDAGPDAARLGLTERPRNLSCRPPATIDGPAAKLSETGCLDPKDPRKPAEGLIPYTVSSPLWSDGAEKQRFLALPEGKTIGVKDCRKTPELCVPIAIGGTGTTPDDGKLDVPAGSVLVKTFAFGGKFIETRLLVRFDQDTWVGYNYEWRDDQTDADLLPDAVGGKDKSFMNASGGTQIWHYPDRAQCLRCHTTASGISLGVELRQLNVDFMYPSGVTSNQLDTWAAIGVFTETPARPWPTAFPLPSGAAGTIESRARSYLQANCAICHRPKGNYDAMDLRFDATPAEMRLCNVAPETENGDLGIVGSKRLVPGDPSKSLIAVRMHRLDIKRMPQIGSLVVDDVGVKAVEAWITSLSACP